MRFHAARVCPSLLFAYCCHREVLYDARQASRMQSAARKKPQVMAASNYWEILHFAGRRLSAGTTMQGFSADFCPKMKHDIQVP
jgi:hypothetical protein